MKKTLLVSAILSVSGALMAPAALAQNTNIDRQEHISKEYQKAMENERQAEEMNKAGDPEYRQERKNIDSQQNISEEYRKAMENEREAAERKGSGMQNEARQHLEERKNIDSQENISEEYRKAMENEKKK